MVENNTPQNVSGVTPDSLPSLEGSFAVESVGNGRPNIFDGLMNRAAYWSAPEEMVDERSHLLPDSDTASAPAVLLMAVDGHGTPMVIGSVNIKI